MINNLYIDIRIYLLIYIALLVVPADMLLIGREFEIEHYTSEDGLPQNFIYCSLQDRKGFLWFGTRNGLTRFDGYKFKVFQHIPFDSNSLSGNHIASICEDTKGNIWVGTYNAGLNYFNKKTKDVIRYIHNPDDLTSISSNTISSIFITSDSILWLNAGFKLNIFIPGRKGFRIPYKMNEKISNLFKTKRINSIKVDANNNVYLILNSEKIIKKITLLKFIHKEARFVILSQFNSPLGRILTIAGFDSLNNIFIHISDKHTGCKLLLFSHKTGDILENYYYGNISFKPDFKSRLYIDDGKKFWLTIESDDKKRIKKSNALDGIYFLGQINQAKSQFSENIRLNTNQVPCLHYGNTMTTDRHGIIWIRSIGGVVKVTDEDPNIINFRHSDIINSINNNFIRAILLDCIGNTYIGTNNGLCIYSKGTKKWRTINTENEPQMLSNVINVIYQDYNGKIFIGTNNGIVIYDPIKMTFSNNHYNNNLSIRNSKYYERVWSILRDKDKNLWIGTINGLWIFNKNEEMLLHFNNEKKSNSNEFNKIKLIDRIWTIYQDHRKTIWVGTETRLLKWQTKRKNFKIYKFNSKDKHSICGNNIWSISEDLNNNLWFGVYGSGISKYNYDTDDFASFTIKEGLPNSGVVSLRCDNSNNLWLGTGKGLVKFEQRTGKFKVFTTSNGFINNDYSFHADFKCSKGFLYFGGLNGFTKFNPEKLKPQKGKPLIAISSFKIFNKEIFYELNDKDSVIIDWDNNYFSFELAVLSFLNSKENKYAYKMTDVSSEWIERGRNRIVSFENLAPGNYIFKAKGCNSDGIWTARPITIYISIVPPFWKTLWFKAFGIFLMILVIASIIGLRIHQSKLKEKRKRLLLEYQIKAVQAQMNPHFIFNSLNSILNLIKKSENKRSAIYLLKFSRLLRCVLENSSHTYIPLSVEIDNLKQYLELEQLRFENCFSYSFEIAKNVNIELIEVPVLLLQPYVENSIRHGKIHTLPNGMLKITFSMDNNYLRCKIIDNGIGRELSMSMKSENNYKSMGTTVNKKRIELLESSVEIIDIKNNDGSPAGTEVILMLKQRPGDNDV